MLNAQDCETAYRLGWRFTGSPELDFEAWPELAGHWHPPDHPERCSATCPDHGEPPCYTQSIDAALMLVPEGFHWYVGSAPKHSPHRFEAYCQEGNKPFSGWVYGKTPALALSVAALRARGLAAIGVVRDERS